MNLVERIKAKARANVKRIVLPEGDEPRTIAAAKIVAGELPSRSCLPGSR